VPAPTVTVFSLHFPASRTARVLRCWSEWMDTYGYLNAMKYFAGCLDKTISACRAGGPAPFRAASRMLERTVTSSAADPVVSLTAPTFPACAG
jgi:hypothetical protein